MDIGPIALRFGDQVIIDASSNHKAKVADFIDNGNLCWPHNRTWELDEIVDSGSNVLPSAQEDWIIWEGATDGKFTICLSWNKLRTHYQRVNWRHLVWFPKAIRKRDSVYGWWFEGP